MPLAGSDEIFLTGLAWQVPANFPGLVKGNVVWSGTMGSDTPGVSTSWKWGAAVYTAFPNVVADPNNYNSVGADPTHGGSCLGYNGGDHAGTPEFWRQYVTGGARVGGGSNFTGSWSSTVSVTPVCH